MRNWAKKLKSTRKIKLVAVALANKTARIVYALLASQRPNAARSPAKNLIESASI